MGFTEIFVADHAGALKRASVLDQGGSQPADRSVRIPGISDFEVEQLGDLAGTAVHAGGADYELTLVDVASDSLLAVPPAMVRALADLLTYEVEGEGNVLDDVAEQWAAQEDMPFDAAQARTYLRQLAELAGGIDDSERTGLYVWAS
ncbi:MAG: hypothetical protein ABWY04_02670 [Arthrobacter sp.]